MQRRRRLRRRLSSDCSDSKISQFHVSLEKWSGKLKQVRVRALETRNGRHFTFLHSTSLHSSRADPIPLIRFSRPFPGPNSNPKSNDKQPPRREIVGTEGPAHCQQLIKVPGRVSVAGAKDQIAGSGQARLIDRPAVRASACVYIVLNGRRLIPMTQIATGRR